MGDWHAISNAETREANRQRILEVLEQYVPSEGLKSALFRFAKKFEEHCWKDASDLKSYNGRVQVEIDSLETFDQLCEDEPFTSRKYNGFLGTIKISYNSKTVAAPLEDRSKNSDLDVISLEESAKTVLRRDAGATFRQAVSRLVSQNSRTKTGGFALANATSALMQKLKAGELLQIKDGIPPAAPVTFSPKTEGQTGALQQSLAHRRKNMNPLVQKLNMVKDLGSGNSEGS